MHKSAHQRQPREQVEQIEQVEQVEQKPHVDEEDVRSALVVVGLGQHEEQKDALQTAAAEATSLERHNKQSLRTVQESLRELEVRVRLLEEAPTTKIEGLERQLQLELQRTSRKGHDSPPPVSFDLHRMMTQFELLERQLEDSRTVMTVLDAVPPQTDAQPPLTETLSPHPTAQAAAERMANQIDAVLQRYEKRGHL